MTERQDEMWCSACGSIVSVDGQCDCTRMETGPGHHVVLRDYLTDEIERLRAQRDELLAALKTLLDPLALSQPAPLPNLVDAIIHARAAIAAVEEKP